MQTLDLPDGYYEIPKGKLANIATFLEMTSKPQRKLHPLPSTHRLEPINPNDLDSYRALFRQIGQDWMWYFRLTMPDEELKTILSHPDVHSFSLMKDEITDGMLELDFRTHGQCEVAFLGLARHAIGKGLGRSLMDQAIAYAWSQPISRLWVHTCTFDHPSALPFYIQSGFTPYTRMLEIHDDVRLLGQLPRTASPQVPLIG